MNIFEVRERDHYTRSFYTSLSAARAYAASLEEYAVIADIYEMDVWREMLVPDCQPIETWQGGTIIAI